MRSKYWVGRKRAAIRRTLISAIRVALLTVGVAAMAALALAQETINSATVSGRVTDPQGAVVAGALVTARQMETNVAAETITNQDGRFRFLRCGTINKSPRRCKRWRKGSLS